MLLHVLVRGRVQGVGFRWFVRERARELGIAGWVRNRDDGCVEVAAAGNADQIAALRAALHRGPPGAWVDGIEELEEPVNVPEPQSPHPFSILR